MERCAYCGSERLARNPEGLLVCMECGSVVSEDAIDDGYYANAARGSGEADRRSRPRGRPLRPRSPVHPLTLRAIYLRVLRLGRVYDYERGRLVSLLDLEAERAASEMSDVAAIRDVLAREGLLDGKSPRVAVGLSLYVLCRAEGRGKERCVEEASRASGASVSRLRKLASEYSPLLDEIAFRVKQEWLARKG